LVFDKPMSMGRRIANEIKLARHKGALRKVLT
jgi:5-formaminoimidazole-4-carboxamide-1-beta-D-ribofuranosyl 5'-monophosphate synthetase